MNREALHALLDRGVLVGDGAMGTRLYEEGISYEHAFDELALSRPDIVVKVHRSYLDAGSRVLQTNTFGANGLRLAEFGAAERVGKINEAAVRLAREVATLRDGTLVAGNVGPTGGIMAPIGRLEAQAAEDAFREQVAALAAAGIDLLVVETFMHLREIEAALTACAREAPDVAIVATMSFTDEGKTIYGEKPEGVARALWDLGAAVVGANCSVGPAPLVDVLDRMVKRAPGLRYAVQPNAGLPKYHGGRYLYLTSPDYMAEHAREFVRMGVGYVGGCCGTTPAHIEAIAEATEGLVPPRAPGHEVPVSLQIYEAEDEIEPESHVRSSLREKLREGRFVTSVEIDPPKGIDATKLVQGAVLCRQAGADMINIADSPLARARMSALSLANLIRREVDVDIILHMSCRDRNLLGLQSEVMGAYALGIRDILAVTGDPPTIGDYPHATGVYDVDAIGLTTLLKRLNDGVDLAGKKLTYRTNFHIGVAVNPTAPDLAKELDRFRQKVDSGAHYAMTQPLYELGPFERFLEAARPTIPILVGILPLRNAKHAEFMHHEVPDITIPEPIRKRMHDAGKDGMQAGIDISREFLLEIRPRCQGVYLMPPFERFEMAASILEVL